jgi:hypothetical protein
MQKYLLFGGDVYYAQGGMNDLISLNNNKNKLIDTILSDKLDLSWWHVWDNENSRIVAGSEEQAFGADCLKESEHSDKNTLIFDLDENDKWVHVRK